MGAENHLPYQEDTVEDLLWHLKKLSLPKIMMVYLHSAIIKSILSFSITIWYSVAITRDKERLQCIIQSAKRMIGCNPYSVHELYTSRTLGRAGRIAADPSLPGQHFPLKNISLFFSILIAVLYNLYLLYFPLYIYKYVFVRIMFDFV